MVPLCMMKQGKEGIIRFICGAGFLAGALEKIGVKEGAEFKIVQKTKDSLILCNEKGQSVVGKRAASMVMAMPLS